MISRCPHCKTSERVTSITRKQTIIRCNDCGVQQTILLAPKDYFEKHHEDKRAVHPHHYVAVSLAFFCILGLLLLVKVAHALP